MIRAATASDHDGLLDVWVAASRIGHPFLDEEFLAAERVEIVQRWLAVSETFVADIDGRVVGFASLIGDEVGAIFVHPDHHRQGIGRALMDSAASGRSVLELDVFEANETGRAFYDAYGFEVVGRSVHDATGHPQLRLRLVTRS